MQSYWVAHMENIVYSKTRFLSSGQFDFSARYQAFSLIVQYFKYRLAYITDIYRSYHE